MNAPTPKLTAALIAARQQMGPALKTALNPHFRSRYVDLAGVGEAADAALWANGLAVVQTMEPGPTGGESVWLRTTLLHVSGEERSGIYPLLPAKDRDPQALGSCLTYARRYGKMAILDLAPEDDDGTAASRPPVQRLSAPAQSQSAPASQTAPPAGTGDEERIRELRLQLGALRDTLAWSNEDLKEWIAGQKYTAQDPVRDAASLTDMVSKLTLSAVSMTTSRMARQPATKTQDESDDYPF